MNPVAVIKQGRRGRSTEFSIQASKLIGAAIAAHRQRAIGETFVAFTLRTPVTMLEFEPTFVIQ